MHAHCVVGRALILDPSDVPGPTISSWRQQALIGVSRVGMWRGLPPARPGCPARVLGTGALGNGLSQLLRFFVEERRLLDRALGEVDPRGAALCGSSILGIWRRRGYLVRDGIHPVVFDDQIDSGVPDRGVRGEVSPLQRGVGRRFALREQLARAGPLGGLKVTLLSVA